MSSERQWTADDRYTDLSRCPRLKSVAQAEVYRWLQERRAYEADLKETCRRKNLRYERHVETWVSCFEDKAKLRTLVFWGFTGEPEDLSDHNLQAKLREIAHKPMNDVEPDVDSMFEGIFLNRDEPDVLERVTKFMTRCDIRIANAGANEWLSNPNTRKRIYTAIIEQLPGRMYTLALEKFKKNWHVENYNWQCLIRTIYDKRRPRQKPEKRVPREASEDFEPVPFDDEGVELRRVRYFHDYLGNQVINAIDEEDIDEVLKILEIPKRYDWMKTEPMIDPDSKRTVYRGRCHFCECVHNYMDCPDSTEEERHKMRWRWGLVTLRLLEKPQFKRMMAEVRKSRKAFGLVRRVLSSASGDSVATLNGRLDVPFCADTGSDENTISLKTIKALQALDPTVDDQDLATPWKGCAVDDQPVYAKQVAKLRVQLHTKAGRANLPGMQSCYVINSCDDFIISRGALESIGIDMNRLLEQVAEHQSLEDGDDVGEPDEGDDIICGVEIRHMRGNFAELDREDRAAAEDLVQNAIVELKKSSEDDEKEIANLWKVVLEAANGGVWRFRGTDEPADVPAMRIKLKPESRKSAHRKSGITGKIWGIANLCINISTVQLCAPLSRQ
ncbi:hypothetical protein AC1031_008200 [Aphanomyces cochlioides]|nr:hypothetical protein AC1031_008200 [Aphanomyces cochlioides]